MELAAKLYVLCLAVPVVLFNLFSEKA